MQVSVKLESRPVTVEFLGSCYVQKVAKGLSHIQSDLGTAILPVESYVENSSVASEIGMQQQNHCQISQTSQS